MVTLDTSALLALLDRREPNHEHAARALEEAGPPYLVPGAVLGEIAYLVERRLGLRALDALLDDLESGALGLECGEDDVPRVRALVQRYADLALGLVDAAVVACGERNGGNVLAFDRDFSVVAREGTIAVLPR